MQMFVKFQEYPKMYVFKGQGSILQSGSVLYCPYYNQIISNS